MKINYIEIKFSFSLCTAEGHLKWLWSGGVRDEGSSAWYWEQSGVEITEFFWGFTYPQMEQNPAKAAIAFNVYAAGWGDFPFDTPYRFGMFCQ